MRSIEPARVDIDSAELVVTWADEHVTRLGLVDLRRSCTCAGCRELREKGARIWPGPGAPEPLRIEHAEPSGAWGLSLRWNDRHEAGIYRWEMLRSWCTCEECSTSP